MDGQAFLEVKDLVKKYDGITAVDHVSFQVSAGESVGLVGESGCGKSTMARMIAGLEPPTEGRILVNGKPYRLQSGRKWKNDINMVFQDPLDSFDSSMTVFSSLREALRHGRRGRLGRDAASQEIVRALKMVELPGEYAGRKVSRLSGGECQRIAIARALLTAPGLLLCDEATSALDVSVQAQIIGLLKRLKEERELTYLFISHDLALVSCMCTRILVMYRGRLVEEGETNQVLTHPAHPYTKLLADCGQAFMLDGQGKASLMPSVPQNMGAGPGGCVFYEFCAGRKERCGHEVPMMAELEPGHWAACHLPRESYKLSRRKV